MILNIRPVLSAIKRNPTGALLVGLQVSITLAVLVNAAWIVHQRVVKIEQPTGINTRDTFTIAVSGSAKQFNASAAETEDLAYLRSLPGVAAATVADGVPLTGNGGDTTVWLQPGHRGRFVPSAEISMDIEGIKTLDVPLIAGRNFRPDEIVPYVPGKIAPSASEAIVTQALAHALFPHGNALGKTIYGAVPKTIIGIARNFMGPQLGSPVYNTIIYPRLPGQGNYYMLLVRTQPGRRDAILRAAKKHIAASHRYGVIVYTQTFATANSLMDSSNRNVAILLTLVTALMLGVCCLGIFGLTTFNVGSRTRQIGTHRALGARRRDVVTHFLLENAIILAGGALLGAILALVIGEWLTTHYALPRLNLAYLLVGIVALAVVGELAAWQPARRAARIPPSVATRTV